MSNPFFTGGPISPERFIGRKRDLNALFDVTGERGHLAIHGSSGMGKSSLLQALASPENWKARQKDPEKAVIVHLNCADFQPFTPAKLWRGILDRMQQKRVNDLVLHKNIKIPPEEETAAHTHVLKAIRAIEEHDRGFLLLLDDYDAAVSANEKYTEAEMLTHLFEFRGIANDTALKRYSTVVATSRRLNELGPRSQVLPAGSPWYNQYTFRPLKPFNDPEIAELVQRMYPRFKVTETVRDAIVELAGGNPALLQYACRLLYEEWEADSSPDPSAFARDFESRTRQYYQNAWTFCSAQEKMSLMLIALSRLKGRVNSRLEYNVGDVDALLSQRGRELNDLIERGLIVKDQQEECYCFASSIMEWWVIKEIENSTDEAELEQREKILLGLSRKQVDQIKGVLKQVWEQKETVKSVIGYVGKLAGAFGKGVATG